MTSDTSGGAAFQKAVKLLGERRRRGVLYIALLPPFPPVFELPREDQEQICGECSLSERQFAEVLARIGQAISALLDKDDESYVEQQVDRLRPRKLEPGAAPFDEDAVREAAAGELSLVRAELVDDELQSRYGIKVTSKAPSFTNLDWDVKVKKFDAKHDIEYPYATCKFKVQRDFEFTPIALLSGRQFDALQVNFTAGDLEYVIRVLTEIRDKLRLLEARGPA